MEGIDHIPLSIEQQQLLNSDQAWHFGIVPKSGSASSLEFYIDPEKMHPQLADELEVMFGKTIVLEKTDSVLIKKNTCQVLP